MQQEKHTEKIKLWGIVQGVGFRPFVAKVADRLHMKGEVLNIGGLVEITVTDTEERIQSFIDVLYAEKPGPSEIVHIKRTPLPFKDFDHFEIIRSDEGDDEATMIPADLAICPHCLEELYDADNPRYQHPFISCMICGPRYTIIDRVPYDRDNTSMIDFPMCDFCEGQYTDLHDRRHHAQTISCHDCGPVLLWKSLAPGQPDAKALTVGGHTQSADSTAPDLTGGDRTSDAAILDQAAAILKDGGVIAFKSVGGYNLVADPFNEKAVAKLRQAKSRETKPFAVMFRSLDEIRSYCDVNQIEASLLESSARPIILLEHRLKQADLQTRLTSEGKSTDDLCKSRFIGSFLPSFAAQYMLLDRISPLIFTSANLSDMPMIKDEDEAFALFERINAAACTQNSDDRTHDANDVPGITSDDNEPLISGVLYNLRQIRLRADDSVTRVIDEQPQMIRRSKGYAPVPLYVEAGSSLNKYSILATGGQLKNSFALTKGPFAYVSQYFGDMDTIENQQIYRQGIDHMSALFRIRPEMVVCDMHPLYFTSAFAQEYAKAFARDGEVLPILPVQHHHAHVASVMAENNLKGPVLGVSFDGTGYGTDGAIWGGEFLLCEGSRMQRMAHLKYVDMIGGDSSMKDGVRSALSYVAAYDHGYLDNEANIRDGKKAQDHLHGDAREVAVDISDIIAFGKDRLMTHPDAPLIAKALDAGINAIKSSSMGRLFDGVSALLGICSYNKYEGQCAIMLEDAAAFAQKHPGEDAASDLALSFHERIIDMIVEQCEIARREYGLCKGTAAGGCDRNGEHDSNGQYDSDTLTQIALTGGTFQNKILMEGVLKKLRARGFEPYYNISVSPNDGGIALGQAFIGMNYIAEQTAQQK